MLQRLGRPSKWRWALTADVLALLLNSTFPRGQKLTSPGQAALRQANLPSEKREAAVDAERRRERDRD